MIILPITPEDKETAKKLGDKMQKATGIISSTRIFTDEAGTQNYIGQLGQLKFHHWLLSEKIMHEYHTFNQEGYGDKFDFLIRGKSIDIDTSHNKYGVPDEKLPFIYYHEKDVKKFDYVIGVRLNNQLTLAKIMGFLSKNEILDLPIDSFGRFQARYCNPSHLHPLHECPIIGKKGLKGTLLEFM